MNEISNEEPKDERIWIRGLYMLLFALFYSVAAYVMVVLVLVQFGYRAIYDECHPRILSLGEAISLYLYQVLRFLSFNTEVMPYPFSDWPQPETKEE